MAKWQISVLEHSLVGDNFYLTNFIRLLFIYLFIIIIYEILKPFKYLLLSFFLCCKYFYYYCIALIFIKIIYLLWKKEKKRKLQNKENYSSFHSIYLKKKSIAIILGK